MALLVRQSVFVVPAIVEIARRRGFLLAADVDLATSAIRSSQAQRDELVAGRSDIAITSADNLFAWNAAGSDIAVIAQIESTTRLVLMSGPHVASLRDLDVVRLGVDAPANGFAIVAYAMMARLGHDYLVIPVGGVQERFAALANGAVDATLLAPPLDETGEELGMSAVMRITDLAPGYPGLAVVASRARLDAGLGAVAAYLAGLNAANTWMRAAGPDGVGCELADAGFGPSAVTAVMSSLPGTLRPSITGMELLEQLRAECGMTIAGAPSPRDLIDPRPLAAAGLVPPDGLPARGEGSRRDRGPQCAARRGR